MREGAGRWAGPLRGSLQRAARKTETVKCERAREEEKRPSAVPVFLASAAGASETSCCREPESFPGEFKTGFASAVVPLAAKGAVSMGEAKLSPFCSSLLFFIWVETSCDSKGASIDL